MPSIEGAGFPQLLALGRGRTDEARASLATVARHARSLMTAGSWDDLQRAIYIDNPSRLTPFPTVDMSGNPR